jgi:transcriptional regulator with XRE-family HTH domain
VNVGPHIGRSLLSYRRQHGLSQRRIAAETGLHQSVISRLERGLLKDISAGTLLVLCGALGLRISDLFGAFLVTSDRLDLAVIEDRRAQRRRHEQYLAHAAKQREAR